MVAASWMIALALVGAPVNLMAKWVGQDGKDFVGPSSAEKPSDVQDMHIVLGGLPPEREIAFIHVTGAGGDEWMYNGPYGPWKAALRREPKARTADLYLEPTRVEKGRGYAIKVRFDDGTTTEVGVRARSADPNLRMPGAALGVRWVGQDKHDWVGPTLAVGPDGIQDVRLTLTKLSAGVKLVSAELEGPGKARWHFGLNPKGHPNAELVLAEKDPTQADFFFQADRDLNGQKLKLTLQYENGKTDTATVAAGHTDPALKMPKAALPTLVPNAVKVAWLGQDGSQVIGRGDVHLSLSNLPAGRAPVAAVLSDSIRGLWFFKQDDRVKLHIEPNALPLSVRRGERGAVDLFFAPIRDESGAAMTLRLVFADGAAAIISFPGGRCDPALRAPALAPTTVSAKPGDDLHDLVNRFGTVKLAPGVYPLDRPLVLNQPVALVGEPGAVLRFTQKPDEKPWTAAVKIHRGPAMLHGFAIRFAGPVRWNKDVSWGPGIIGLTDSLDPPVNDLRANLAFTKLDIESPPAANPNGWEDPPRLMRLIGGSGGKIAGNVLRGGTIELFSGPWQIVDNDYRGTPPGTVSSAVIVAHDPHDLIVRDNRAKPIGPSGKTWRFLVLTGSGFGDRIENNTIESIGARDDDTIPDANSPEILLTESYTLKFEGKPAAVSSDGRVLRIARAHGGQPGRGDVVAILAGPNAGQWRRISQALEPTTYLLETPLPAGTGAEVVSITSGFVNEVFQGNVVDARGSVKTGALVLAGNHFGTVVRNNRFVGGGASIQLTAYPTEAPMIWGWSHVPFLGGIVEQNVIEDVDRGSTIAVEHTRAVKSNAGRVYMALTLRNNTVRWTPDFLAQRTRKGAKGLPPGIVIGMPGGLDAGELVIDAKDNHLQSPPGTPPGVSFHVHGAVLNGKKVVEQGYTLPPETSPAQVGRRN